MTYWRFVVLAVLAIQVQHAHLQESSTAPQTTVWMNGTSSQTNATMVSFPSAVVTNNISPMTEAASTTSAGTDSPSTASNTSAENMNTSMLTRSTTDDEHTTTSMLTNSTTNDETADGSVATTSAATSERMTESSGMTSLPNDASATTANNTRTSTTGNPPSEDSTVPPTITSSATMQAATSAPSTDDNTILVAVLVCFGVVVVALAAVLYFYCKKRSKPRDGEEVPLNNVIDNSNKSFRNKSRFVLGKMMVMRGQLEREYVKKSSDDNRIFRMEYMAIQHASGEATHSALPENQLKNRYDNIHALDATRVVLRGVEDDYINANYVSGYEGERKWIATQGPKEETADDFWRMTWQENSRTIIMITNLIEQGRLKCYQYWPDDQNSEDGSQVYGDYKVTLQEEKQRNFYVLRILTLQKGSEAEREIKQFHYTAWPDFGVPSNASQLLQFRRRVNSSNPPDAGPIIIHCSAGVGRTGTYIVVDAAIRQVDAEAGADFFTFLSKIRGERMKLIQTDAQYAFAHKAVVEYIKYGNTEMNAQEFIKKVSKIREEHERGEETVLEDEFQMLLKIPLMKDNMQHGRANLKKNRLLQIVPYDFNRIILPRKPGQEKSEYINASYIDGCQKRGAFIAAQGPLPETVQDFWTMIWENEVKRVAMIVKLQEKGLDTCALYWPETEDEPLTLGDITVTMTSQDDVLEMDYIVRQFTLSHTQFPDTSRLVKQFHYVGWPDIGGRCPDNPSDLINLITAVLHDAEDHTNPIVVHCSSGGGRTGVFCCLAILLGQLEGDGVADVIQTVRHLREQRPHLIQTQEQYNFCYFALLQHLEGSINEASKDGKEPNGLLSDSIDDGSSSAPSQPLSPPITPLPAATTPPPASPTISTSSVTSSSTSSPPSSPQLAQTTSPPSSDVSEDEDEEES